MLPSCGNRTSIPYRPVLVPTWTTWPGQNGQIFYQVLASREDYVAAHPYIICRFLTSLHPGTEVIEEHPAKARAIVQEWLESEDAYIEMVWPENRSGLSPDQSLNRRAD